MTLREAIEEFIKHWNNYNNHGKSTVKNLLAGSKPYALLQQPGMDFDREKFNEDDLLRCIRDSIVAYRSSKASAFEIYDMLIAYLNGRFGRSMELKGRPPVDISNITDRMMYLVKRLQVPEVTVEQIAEELWMSVDTIKEDIAKLRGRSTETIRICGKEFMVGELRRDNGKVYFDSSAHPLFLTGNLTQILVLLKGLKAMSEDRQYKAYAETMASEIWDQLSDYARERIPSVLKDLMNEDPEWYISLGSRSSDNAFTSEKACSLREKNSVIYWLKNDGECCIAYQKDDGTDLEILEHCTVKRLGDDTVTVVTDSNERELVESRIVGVAATLKDLLALT